MDLGIYLTSALLVSLAFLLPPDALGHGIGSETFPPVDLNGKQVTLEASSTQDNADYLQISLSFLDFESKITLRDVTFHIVSERGQQFLFEEEFRADNGILVFNFVSADTSSVSLEQETDGDLFASLLGLENKTIHVKGPRLNEGGLYKFDVSILTADGYSKQLDEPLVYNVGISIPHTVHHNIEHPDYGTQTIQTVTYYDELSNFNYNIPSKMISFEMPFDWSESNIEQTSVIHEELIIPKTFGDLLSHGFSVSINNTELPDHIITVDDFGETRIVHFVLSQQDLWEMFGEGNQTGMDFVIKPKTDKAMLSTITENNQFRILASWEPERLESDSRAVISFDIMDVFLKNSPVAVNYDLSVTHGTQTIFQQSGLSTDSEIHNTAEFMIPKDTSGIIHLNFDNLSGNPSATASVPIIVDSTVQDTTTIPSWIKTAAGWWADGSVDDQTFLQGIEFLIQNNIIQILHVEQQPSDVQEIPSWIKTAAGWWADGSVDDQTFVSALQFLIGQGILQV